MGDPRKSWKSAAERSPISALILLHIGAQLIMSVSRRELKMLSIRHSAQPAMAGVWRVCQAPMSATSWCAGATPGGSQHHMGDAAGPRRLGGADSAWPGGHLPQLPPDAHIAGPGSLYRMGAS